MASTTPTKFLDRLKKNWDGLVVIGIVLAVGWFAHAKWGEIQAAPEEHDQIIAEIERVEKEGETENDQQWQAIRGILRVQNALIENQTILICNIEGMDLNRCMPTSPAEPFTLPDSLF